MLATTSPQRSTNADFMAPPVIPISRIARISSLYKIKQLIPDSVVAHQPDDSLNNKISIICCDITKLQVDAIVNAANRSLLGGGGVDGAIHRAAGRGLYNECKTLGGCATGSAKITRAYGLPCKAVIHAVGPIYHSAASPEDLLRSCYRTSLDLAVTRGLKTVAFSAISTGVYGYPKLAAAEIAVTEVRRFLTGDHGKDLDRVIFCQFDTQDEEIYKRIIPIFFPPAEADLPETDTQSQFLAEALPDAPTAEPVQPEEPVAKKQKVEADPGDDSDKQRD